MPPLNLCVIGAGDWATRMHQPVLKRLVRSGWVVCAAVCDRRREAAAAYAAALGCERVFTDAAAMLEQCRPDGAVILVPPLTTPEMVRLAAGRGVPFLVEKPPAPDADVHRRLIDAAGDLVHVVGYNRRHAPYIARARQWIARQVPQSVTALFTRHRRHDADFSTTAVHAIDTARFLAASDLADVTLEAVGAGPVLNRFIGGWTVAGSRIDIQIMPDTASSQEHYIVRSAERTAIVAFPQSGTIDLPGWVALHEGNREVCRMTACDFGVDPTDLPGLGGIRGEHEAFIRAVRGDEAARSTLADTLQTQRLGDELVRLTAGNAPRSTRVRLNRPAG